MRRNPESWNTFFRFPYVAVPGFFKAENEKAEKAEKVQLQ